MTTHRWPRPSRWATVGLTTLVLVGGSLLPVPFERHSSFEGLGPDTILHFLGYAGLAVTLADALADDEISPASRGLLTVGTATGIAVGTGRLQRYVPGRAHERTDVLAGIFGAIMGVLWTMASAGRWTPDRERDRVYRSVPR